MGGEKVGKATKVCAGSVRWRKGGEAGRGGLKSKPVYFYIEWYSSSSSSSSSSRSSSSSYPLPPPWEVLSLARVANFPDCQF